MEKNKNTTKEQKQNGVVISDFHKHPETEDLTLSSRNIVHCSTDWLTGLTAPTNIIIVHFRSSSI